MVIDEMVTHRMPSIMSGEILRCAQGDSATSVILSEAKNPALCHYLPGDH